MASAFQCLSKLVGFFYINVFFYKVNKESIDGVSYIISAYKSHLYNI